MDDVVETYEDQFAHLVALAQRVALRIVGNAEDAEDVAVEALARAYPRWAQVAPYADNWVVRVATNLALDQVRRGPAPAIELGGAPATGEASVLQRVVIVASLRRLSRRQREVLALTYLCDLPLADAAEVLGLSVGSIKQHQHRGLAALRRLAPEGGGATWSEAT